VTCFAKLQDVQLECADALYIIKSRDRIDSFFYVDPPYYNSDMGHYDGYSLNDFTELLELLSSIKGKFLLSSYPSPILAEFTKKFGWHIQTKVSKVSVAAKDGNQKLKTEVLTANFKI
jgi:DNA adenine methylase